jgi:hypothetical protein
MLAGQLAAETGAPPGSRRCFSALAAFTEVRRFFSEGQIAELARCLADHHFLDDSIP